MATQGSEDRIQDSAQNWFHFSLAGQCQGSPIWWRTQLVSTTRQGQRPQACLTPSLEHQPQAVMTAGQYCGEHSTLNPALRDRNSHLQTEGSEKSSGQNTTNNKHTVNSKQRILFSQRETFLHKTSQQMPRSRCL